MEYMAVLLGCPLFAGHDEAEIEAMLACLGSVQVTRPRHTLLYAAGAEDYAMGVLLDGQLDIIQEDYWGNQGIIARLAPGDIFAESFVLAGTGALPVSILAAQDATVLLLDYRRILHTCEATCAFHDGLIANLLSIVARKNILLTQKIEHITKRTLREKLLSYLSSQAQRAGGSRFVIPYDRQALADYLGADRSALSRALSDMQAEGLLTYHKSEFTLRQAAK